MDPVVNHLRRLGVPAKVNESASGLYRVRYELPEKPPLISVIIPTLDAPDYLRNCVDSLLEKSSYRNFEVLVIDNQSTHPEALRYLQGLRKKSEVRVLSYKRPFNYSAINNFANRHANGEILCLLNNDTEVISEDWMEEMLGRLLQPGVGVVGAKLYYSDGRVQHAGDAVGPGGCADHLHSMIEKDDPGYCNRAMLAQDLSAVTAACLMTSRKLFTDLGGLDAKNLPVSFNDVDYCLRVRAKGLRVIWTPHAELYHHESISRGKDLTEEQVLKTKREANYMRRRWKHLMSHDPFYNPNLSYNRPDFSLNTAPIIKKPWRR
jgi:GT2 family glycosyltransferase